MSDDEFDLTHAMKAKKIAEAEYREMQSDDVCQYCANAHSCAYELGNCVEHDHFSGIKVLIENN
jgi:hypothetical protein